MHRRTKVAGLVAVGSALAFCAGRPQTTSPVRPVRESVVEPRQPPAASHGAAAELEAPDAPIPVLPEGETEVRCTLLMAEPVDGEASLTIDLDSGPNHRFQIRTVQVEAGAITFDDPLPDSLHQGTLTLPGYGRVELEWTPRDGGGFDCAPVPMPLAAIVTGTVSPPARGPEDRRVVVGCSGRAIVEPDGSFYAEVQPGDCALEATRRDGAYIVTSEPVQVSPTLGAEIDVHLSLPERDQAGIGVRVEDDPHGLAIIGVRTGSAADLAGLRRGDVIHTLDGTSAAAIGAAGLSRRALGDVGSTVIVDLIHEDGGREAVALVRTWLDPDQVFVDVPNGREARPNPGAWVE